MLNAKKPEEIGVKTEAQLALDNDKPLEYGYVDDRDIMFSKMTWEKIVLDERANFPLYYPVDTNNIGKERRSLYDVLLKNVRNGNIENIYDDSSEIGADFIPKLIRLNRYATLLLLVTLSLLIAVLNYNC